MTWKDIKHLQLEDDDIIYATWVDDENEGYWHGEIIRNIEETDEQFTKRQKEIKEYKERMRKMRYESYLRLKKEFEV